jgi:hypothetical protein
MLRPGATREGGVDASVEPEHDGGLRWGGRRPQSRRRGWGSSGRRPYPRRRGLGMERAASASPPSPSDLIGGPMLRPGATREGGG